VAFFGNERYVAAGEFIDQKGQLVISVNIVVGDDDDLYANPQTLIRWKV